MASSVVIVGVDESDHSLYALEWILNRFFVSSSNPPFKLVVIHAKPSASSYAGFLGPGYVDTLPILESDLKAIAVRLTAKAKDLCAAKSVHDATVEIVNGDARNVLCEAVERYQAAMLVVGSHGYGAIKRAVLGSVSDYCAHHAHCNVMIVKRPKKGH